MAKIDPKKSLGQNFLTDKNIAGKIVSSLSAGEGDTIMEIGPGPGALTAGLAELPAKLAAVEIDIRACNELNARFPKDKYPNVDIIHADFMDFDIAGYVGKNGVQGRVKIVGNLPYYISSRILYKVIENAGYFEKAVFMVQKEVADRLASRPGNKSFGILTVAVNYAGTIRKLFDVPPQCFFPRPKVTSTVFELSFKKDLNTSIFPELMEIVKAAFNQRRKKLRNALSGYCQEKHGGSIDSLAVEDNGKAAAYFEKRAEQLSWEDYYYLWELMCKQKR